MGWINLLRNPKTAGKCNDKVKPLKPIKGAMTKGEVKMKAGMAKKVGKKRAYGAVKTMDRRKG